WVARNRYCLSGACDRHVEASLKTRLCSALPLVLLPLASWFARPLVAPWVFMWLMAFSLYGGCKWLTYRQVAGHWAIRHRCRALRYLLGWPGMDAASFLSDTIKVERPSRMEWIVASLKTLFGAAAIWLVVRTASPSYPLVSGWIGMIGAIFALHF